MEVILPYGVHSNEQKLINCALDVNYDEFAALKLVFTNNKSDLDVFELIGDERIQQLLYGWEICNMQIINSGSEMSANLQYMIKVLAYLSLKMWFGQEWKQCSNNLRELLIIYLDQARYVFAKIETLSKLKWDYLLDFNQEPWRLPYLQKLFRNLQRNMQVSIEHTLQPVNNEDIEYLKVEGTHIILLRLIKLFDSGSWEAVKQLTLRVLVAWVHRNRDTRREVNTDEKQCVMLIAHLYLMAVYVSDDNHGYNIDNMMHNIRFYAQSMQGSLPSEQHIEYTPARLIACVCVLLRLNKNQFFERLIFHSHDQCMTTLFGVISQTYKSYLLGNLLMELNAMNEEDFTAHFAQFQLFIHRYVDEREFSEKFLLNEARKQTAQRNSHAVPNVLKLNIDYKSFICKGNFASNISNENKDVKLSEASSPNEDCDRKIDPIFQTIPDNEKVLNYVYEILAKRTHSGWRFAKIILLLKIIGHKLNMIETWRYHPGLTTEFMLNLEQKLSEHYADLAKIFHEFPFMEQEFWLTAYYLQPNRAYYHEVKRCGVRANRRRQNIDEELQASRTDKAIDSTKFGLLSSTISVKEIVRMSNHERPNTDYDPIRKSLMSLHLPNGVIKDLLTVIFLPRNRSFSWALDWGELREHCKDILHTAVLKRRFVELNMAEANDRLKYLKIDYEKYKHRPQLDYGTIEEGYENIPNNAEGKCNNGEDDDEEEFECSPKKVEQNSDSASKRKIQRRKYWDEESVSEESDKESNDSDSYYTGSRRTRARTAAVIATAMFKDDIGRRIDKSISKSTQKVENMGQNVTKSEPPEEPTVKRSFRELLQSGVKQSNSTVGFHSFPDIWNFGSNELSNVDNDENNLMQWSFVSKKMQNLKDLKQTVSLALAERGSRNPKCEAESEAYDVRSTEAATHTEFFRAPSAETTDDDNESFHSDMTTMAHQDSDEASDIDDDEDNDFFNVHAKQNEIARAAEIHTGKNQMEQSSAVIKTQTCGSMGSKESNATQLESLAKINNEMGDSQIQNESNPHPSQTAEQRLKERLINECLTRSLHVSLCRLKAEEIRQLREPRIRVKRFNIENYYENVNRRVKRARLTSPSYYYGADDSGSTSATYTSDELPKKQRRKRNLKRNFTSTESSTDFEDSRSGKHTHKRSRKKRLVVTPRSESGLKLRISSKDRGNIPTTATTSPELIECIQLSSSTNSSSSPTFMEAMSYRAPGVVDIQNVQDPLYEEEVVPFR